MGILAGLRRPHPAPAVAQPVSPPFAARLVAGSCPLPAPATLGRDFPPYRPLFDFPGEFVDSGHNALVELPVRDGLIQGPVPGYLRPADALALYELAYFATGDVLELGSFRGLSATILCTAAQRAGRGVLLWSVERDAAFQRATAEAIQAQGLGAHYRPLLGDATRVLARLVAEQRRFSVVFVDHDHSHPATRAVCRHLGQLLLPSGIAVFHDLNDARNVSEPAVYGVHRALAEALAGPELSFLGLVGCSGLVWRSAP